MKATEQAALLDSLLDGTISEADWLRIEAELSVDASVRREYYRRLQLDVLLEREASSTTDSNHALPKRFSVWPSRGGLLVGAILTLAASGLLMLLAPGWGDSLDAPASRVSNVSNVEPSASGFAVLNGQAKADWAGQQLAEGDLLPAGTLHLRSGRIHLELFSGVHMVVEGESRFSVDSPMQVTLLSGRARAQVPESAHGFRVKTNTGDVIDLGTEFTVDIDDEGADVHVVDGEVELQPSTGEVRRMHTGTALRLDERGTVADATGEQLQLIGPSEFQQLLEQQQATDISRWEAAAEQQRSDARLIAYYRFQPDQQRSRQLQNLASAAKVTAGDASIVAAQPAVDRWGRSGAALDFSPVGSRVRVNIPGQHRGLTCVCWVKINSLDRWYNSLFLTDGHEDREPHWQIMDDGRIFFSIKSPPRGPADSGSPRQHIFYSPKVWDASLSGRWLMLGVTYDVDGAVVVHYLNGRPISREAIPAEYLVDSILVGPASICNWNEPMYRTDPKFVLRNLNGSMDEFAMYSGALSADEIQQLYRVGISNDQ